MLYTSKNFLFGVNLASAICGFYISMCSINLVLFLGHHYTVIVLAVCGQVILVVSLFACCGSIVHSWRILMLISIIAQFVLMFCVTLLGLQSLMHYRTDIVRRLLEQWDQRDVTTNWYQLQSVLRCCGLDGIQDYESERLTPMPLSCCPNDSLQQAAGKCTNNLAYTRGCRSKYVPKINTYMDMMGYVLLMVSGLQTIAIMLGIFLSLSALKRN